MLLRPRKSKMPPLLVLILLHVPFVLALPLSPPPVLSFVCYLMCAPVLSLALNEILFLFIPLRLSLIPAPCYSWFRPVCMFFDPC